MLLTSMALPMQGVPGGVSTAQSTGVFLGAPFNSLDASAAQNAQLYAQQLQQQGEIRGYASALLCVHAIDTSHHK